LLVNAATGEVVSPATGYKRMVHGKWIVFSENELDDVLRNKGLHSKIGQLSEKERDKIARILSGNIVPTSPPPEPFSCMFAAFCEKHPAWAEPSAWLFWQNPKFPQPIDSFLIRSIQVSRTCFMHAAVALQHYLVVMNTGHSDHTKVDMNKFLLDHVHGDLFENYLSGIGQYSWKFMCNLIGRIPLHKVRVMTESLETNKVAANEIADVWLRKLGPGLVSMFPIDAGFGGNSERTSFLTGTVVRALDEDTHSMLIVGCRADPVHGHVFLLQNWWRKRELIEVSLEYLTGTGSHIHFVDDVIDSIPSEYKLNSDAYTETGCDIGDTGSCDV